MAQIDYQRDPQARTVLRLDWRQSLSRGQIVSFQFPVVEADGEAPKARPCLVLDAWTTGALRFVCLAYGTTSDARKDKRGVLALKRIEEAQAAGLDRPTRFLFDRRVIVSTQHSGFRTGRERDWPILGHLSQLRISRLPVFPRNLH